MYRVIASMTAIRMALFVFGLSLAAIWLLSGPPTSLPSLISMLSLASFLFVGVIWICFGTRQHWAPWRAAWRRWPVLGQLFYPDLNGLWAGKMRSNWHVIQALRSAAGANTSLDLDELGNIELQDVDVVFQVMASLFGVRIQAQFGPTVDDRPTNSSRTVFVFPSRNDNTDMLVLSYIFEQSTPEPGSSDESTHHGAARVAFSFQDGQAVLSGDYWTKRRWREGMNTAGHLSLARVTDRHARLDEDLRSAVKRSSEL